MIGTVLLGKAMIGTGLSLWAGLIAIQDKNIEYVVDKVAIRKSINKILPNNTHIFYIEDDDDLENALIKLNGHLFASELAEIKYRYNSPKTFGVTFEGANAVIIYVRNIRNRFNDIYKASSVIYVTVFHELYHLLLASRDEELVQKKAMELYRKHKSILPLALTHFDNTK